MFNLHQMISQMASSSGDSVQSRSRLKGMKTPPPCVIKCKLCHTAPETRKHFLAECSAYTSERETYTEKLRNNPVLSDEIKSDLRNPDLLTQLTLDASFHVETKDLEVLELDSREYIVQIHKKRIAKLNEISRC